MTCSEMSEVNRIPAVFTDGATVHDRAGSFWNRFGSSGKSTGKS